MRLGDEFFGEALKPYHFKKLDPLPSFQEGTTSSHILFVNGFFVAAPTISGVEIKKLSPESLEVTIASNTVLVAPLEVLFLHEGEEVESTPSLHIKVGDSSQLTLVESSQSLHDEVHWERKCMTLDIGQNVQLTHIKKQLHNKKSFPFARRHISISANSHYRSFLLQQGANMGREVMDIHLNASGASVEALGASVLQNEQQSDLYLTVHHHVPQTQSEQYYKNILDDQSKVLFRGEIKIDKKAQGTNARQLCRTLLLGAKAKIEAEPHLEIEADDVQCSHGATVGQLNADELFYLQSRGLSKGKAERLLSFGFAYEVINRLPTPLQETLLIPFRERFGQLHLPKGE